MAFTSIVAKGSKRPGFTGCRAQSRIQPRFFCSTCLLHAGICFTTRASARFSRCDAGHLRLID
jgi:hypothetical protein